MKKIYLPQIFHAHNSNKKGLNFYYGIKKSVFISLFFSLFLSNSWAESNNFFIKNKIAVYPYVAPDNGFSFEQFLVFLDSNTGNLIDEISELIKVDTIKLKENELKKEIDIEIYPLSVNNPKAFLKTNELEKISKSNSQVIEILSGTIVKNQINSGYTINSKIYSDNFFDISRRKQILLKENSNHHSTPSFLNSHHVALLYALAMDAKSRKEPSWLIIRLLSKAQELSHDIDLTDSVTTRKLKNRIIHELTEQERLTKSIN